MTFSYASSKIGARQGLAQTQIAAYDHAQRSATPIDLVWLTWSWMTFHGTQESSRVNGWGALHLGNGSELQIRFLMRAPSVMWAVRGYAFRFLAPARPGDGALPNSDMRGRDPFLNKISRNEPHTVLCSNLLDYGFTYCNLSHASRRVIAPSGFRL